MDIKLPPVLKTLSSNDRTKIEEILKTKMIDKSSPVSTTSTDSTVLAVQAYTGLHLEPPTRDVVSYIVEKTNEKKKEANKVWSIDSNR